MWWCGPSYVRVPRQGYCLALYPASTLSLYCFVIGTTARRTRRYDSKENEEAPISSFVLRLIQKHPPQKKQVCSGAVTACTPVGVGVAILEVGRVSGPKPTPAWKRWWCGGVVVPTTRAGRSSASSEFDLRQQRNQLICCWGWAWGGGTPGCVAMDCNTMARARSRF